MCGITAAIAERNVVPILLEGLKRLEYRGYDSAGLAVLHNNEIQRVRAVGKVAELVEKTKQSNIHGQIGIAHTRWATHGKPTEQNAHPHLSNNELAIVHNGIIENFAELREDLKKQGVEFTSETDTEVVAHLLNQATGKTPTAAIADVVKELKGAYALAILSKKHPDRLFAVRSGSPLVIGLGIGENFIASDALSLLPVTNRFIYLEEGDIAEITRTDVTVYNAQGKSVNHKVVELRQEATSADKGPYKHYMLKEIYEQPIALTNTLDNVFLNDQTIDAKCFGEHAEAILKDIHHIKIVACGTSYHAGLVAKFWLESFAKLPCDVEIASEFRYRDIVVPENSLFITLSQSGETADTLAALRFAKEQGFAKTLCICNVPNSSLTRESDLVFMTKAGPEIGVASTKAFTTQLAALLLLTGILCQLNHYKTATDKIIEALKQLPNVLNATLNINDAIEKLAQQFLDKTNCLFLGRGSDFPIAMEGALKLKEISYIHAEAYPAGELKHGPLALVDKDMPVIIIAPENDLFEKIKSNIQEVAARGGELYVISDTVESLTTDHQLKIPKINPMIAPIVHTLPLQLLSYHVAVIKGTDVDQPRNLAKSVTVE